MPHGDIEKDQPADNRAQFAFNMSAFRCLGKMMCGFGSFSQ